MAKQVISFVADDNYLDHARAVLVNCRRQGLWQGDFCMISPEDCDNQDFEARGIHVLRIPTDRWSFLIKFHIFSPYFHQWEQALCTDLDIMVQAPLQNVFDELTSRGQGIYCTMEDGNTLDALKRWDDHADEHADTYERVQKQFPHVVNRMYNASFIFYTPKGVPPETESKLYAIHEEFKEINPTNADQMIFNLGIYWKIREASKNCACFFGSDYPENRVPSQFRNWIGDEVPAILHYTRWHAPWIVKCICNDGNEMGGYRNHRLGRLCHELYAENLAAFETEFPLVGSTNV